MIQQKEFTEQASQASPQVVKVLSENLSFCSVMTILTLALTILMIIVQGSVFIPDAHQSQLQSPCYFDTELVQFANYEQNIISCLKEYNQTNPRGLYIENYKPAQLFLLVQATYLVPFMEFVSTQNITYRFSIWDVSKENGTLVEIAKMYYSLNQSDLENNCFLNNGKVVQCDPVDIVYITQKNYKSFLVLVEIVSEQKWLQSHSLQLQVTAISTSMTYTYFLIGVRYTFMILSIISALWYAIRLYRLPSIYNVIEQKMILVLSILVIFYDDPMYAMTVLAPNQITTMLGTLFLANFYAYLSLFQLVMAHRMVHENGQKDTKAINWSKVTVCLLLWVCIIMSYTILELNFFSDPLSYYDQNYTRCLKVFQVIGILTGSFILIFLIVKFIQFKKDRQSKLFRYDCQQLFVFAYMPTFFVFLILGFFFTQNNAYLIIFSVPILNQYVQLLQYSWAPSQVGIESIKIVNKAETNTNQNNQQDQLDNGGLIIEGIEFNEKQQIEQKQK